MKTFLDWPVLRQLRGDDVLGRGTAARSAKTEEITSRTTTADSMARSVCPFCAVGCGQRVFVKDGEVTQIEGDPDSPDLPRPAVSQGRGQQEPGDQPAASDHGALPPSARHRVGGPRPAHRDGDDRGPGGQDAA